MNDLLDSQNGSFGHKHKVSDTVNYVLDKSIGVWDKLFWRFGHPIWVWTRRARGIVPDSYLLEGIFHLFILGRDHISLKMNCGGLQKLGTYLQQSRNCLPKVR